MNKKAKIAIAITSTLVIGITGILIYRAVNKRNESARKYLSDIDESGGEVPDGELKKTMITASKRFPKGSATKASLM